MAPLFETLDDLTRAPSTIETLFSNEWYLKHIKGSQECMIGAGRGSPRGGDGVCCIPTMEHLGAQSLP